MRENRDTKNRFFFPPQESGRRKHESIYLRWQRDKQLDAPHLFISFEERGIGMKIKILFLVQVFILVFSFPLLANEKKTPGPGTVSELQDHLARLEAVMDSLKSDYTLKLRELQNKLDQLEESKEKEKKETALEQLLDEAQTYTRKEKKEDPTIARVFHGGQRQLQVLNPNISLTGDFYGSVTSSGSDPIRDGSEFSDGRNRFFMREAEFHVIAPLDPFTRGKFFLGIPGAGDDPLSFMIGEAYIEIPC